ncbi:MAG TPA: glycosyltransferase [Beijerinckiaceae bacterium]
MPPPFLSVVMPVHDGERWLDAALGSLAAQGEPDLECILVDSSRDGSLAVARRYEGALDVVVHHRPDLRSWQAKTNFGVSLARGTHIGMLHQDDVWLRGRAATVRRWVEAAPDTVLFLHPCSVIDERERNLGVWRCPLPEGRAVDAALLHDRLLVQNFVAIPAPTIRRDAFLAVGGLDEALWYTADWDLYLKLAAHGPVGYANDVLAGFRVHSGSLTVTGSRRAGDFREQMEIVLARHGARASRHRERVLRKAQASVAINAALAAAHQGEPRALGRALSAFLGLGPVSALGYLRDSRLHERVLPRLKARLAGAF